MAVQMALLCSSQAGINCAGVSQNTFTLFMSAEAAQLPGVNGRCVPFVMFLLDVDQGHILHKAAFAPYNWSFDVLMSMCLAAACQDQVLHDKLQAGCWLCAEVC